MYVCMYVCMYANIIRFNAALRGDFGAEMKCRKDKLQQTETRERYRLAKHAGALVRKHEIG